MTKISAEMVLDSCTTRGHRISTLKVTFPRFILAELNTHRVFSRNSASSRAIPFKKMVEMVETNPFIPIAWQKDHSGMQGTEYLTELEIEGLCILEDHLTARDNAVVIASAQNRKGVTKQLANRYLEPFMWHTVLITSTEWENFFELRCPQYYFEPEEKYFRSRKDWMKYYNEAFDSNDDWDVSRDDLFWLEMNKGQAEIHMMALAEAIWDAMNQSTPLQLESGQWHIPYCNNLDFEELETVTANYYRENPNEVVDVSKWLLKIASARAARVSYTAVGYEDKAPDYAKDIQLHDRLLEAGHMSPFEHCGKAMSDEEYFGSLSGNPFRTQHDTVPFDNEEKDKPAILIHEHYLDPEDDRFGWSRNFRGFVQYRSVID